MLFIRFRTFVRALSKSSLFFEKMKKLIYFVQEDLFLFQEKFRFVQEQTDFFPTF